MHGRGRRACRNKPDRRWATALLGAVAGLLPGAFGVGNPGGSAPGLMSPFVRAQPLSTQGSGAQGSTTGQGQDAAAEVCCEMSFGPSGGPVQPAPDLRPYPSVVALHSFGSEIDLGAVSGVAVCDLDGDRQPEVLVAWYVTDFDDSDHNRRRLSILRPDSNGELEIDDEIDLFVPHVIPPLSIFSNGTGEIVPGDFDGDGDTDVAVLPFFNDELWLFDNDGGTLTGYVKFPFGINSPLNGITPPRGFAADFDGDGRDELVYLADPLQRFDGATLHFWKSEGDIQGMHRVQWEGGPGSVAAVETRALVVRDFDDDGRPDLCFSGVEPPLNEPALELWHHLNPSTGVFDVDVLRPEWNASDLATADVFVGCPPLLVLGGPDGGSVQFWAVDACEDEPLAYEPWMEVEGLAGISPDFGVAIEVGRLTSGRLPQVVVRQKLGNPAETRQIDVLAWQGGQWDLVLPPPVDTGGLAPPGNNQIQRPRAIALADLAGNARPELIVGFGPSPDNTLRSNSILPLAVYQNGCLGDVNGDGRTSLADLFIMFDHFGCARPTYDRNADLNKDGCVDLQDVALLMGDMGCGGSPDQ